MDKIEFSDVAIESFFAGFDYGNTINNSTQEKRKYLLSMIERHYLGFWLGSASYQMLVEIGFIREAPFGNENLTGLGKIYLRQNGVELEDM